MSEWIRKIFGIGAAPKEKPSDIGSVVEGVTPHTHCARCGKAITLGKKFCSDLCKRGEGKGPASTMFWILLLLMLLMLLWGR